MKVNDIIKILEELAPKAYAEDWDNPGLLVGRKDAVVDCIYVALDATEDAILVAKECKAQLLLTHHPMIFSPLKQINDGDFIGRRILDMIENGISYYAMHTNFDVAKMAWLAADRLKLSCPEVLEVTVKPGTCGNEISMGIGCAGNLPREMSIEACADFVKKVFHIPNVKIFGDVQRKVARAAVCPGSGKHMTGYAIARGCDVLITGDVDHHEGIDAVSQGISIIDAGHHGIEHIFVDFMTQYLEERLSGVRIVAEENRPPFLVM